MNRYPHTNQEIHLIYNGEGYCHVGNPCGRDNCNTCRPKHSHSHQCTQISTDCVFYGKDASVPSLLRCMQIPVGSSLTYILEAFDKAICDITRPDYSIFNYSCFDEYQVTNQQQFVEVIATELCLLKAAKISLGHNYNTDDFVKVRFIDEPNTNKKIPRTELDIESILYKIKDTPLLKELFCSICPVEIPPPVPQQICCPTPVYLPIPVPTAPPIPLPIPLPIPIILPQPVPPVPVGCTKIVDYSYTINGQTNSNNFVLSGTGDVNVNVFNFSPNNYSTPVTFEFILNSTTTGPITSSSYIFQNVGIGNHLLTIIVTNCGQITRKDINFSKISLPVPVFVPVPVPTCTCTCFNLYAINTAQQATFNVTYCDNSTGLYVLPVNATSNQVCARAVSAVTNGTIQACSTNCCNTTTQAYNIQQCGTGTIVQKQLALSGNLAIGTVIKETSSGTCYTIVSQSVAQYPYLSDYSVISGDCSSCIPSTNCEWVDDVYFCEGTTRKVTQIDGCGNSRTLTIEENSKHCGYFSAHIQFYGIYVGDENLGPNNPEYCHLGCRWAARLVADTDHSPYTLNITWSASKISGGNLLQPVTLLQPPSNIFPPQAQVEIRYQGPNCIACSTTIRVTADVVVNGYSFQFHRDFYGRHYQ